MRPRRPAFVGRRYLDDVPLEELAKYIDWTLLLLRVGAEGAISGDPRSPAVRRRRARAVRTRADAAEEDHRRAGCSARAASTRSGRQWRTATTSSVYKDEDRREVLARLPMLRQQEAAARRTAQPVARRLHRAERERRSRLPRHVRRHRRHGAERPGRSDSKRTTTTTTRSW